MTPPEIPESSDRLQRLEETVAFLQHEQDALSGEIANLHNTLATLQREIDRLKRDQEASKASESDPNADEP